MAQFEGDGGTGRLDQVVVALCGLSRSRCAVLIREGRVQVDGEVVTKPSTKVEAASRVHVAVPAPVSGDVVAQDLPLKIVYQDEDLAVIDKAAGMVVHPAPGHRDGTLVNALLHHLDDLSGIGGVERPGIVHRLDKGTTGLIVVAKNDAAHQALSAQFADRTAGREYLAWCIGEPSAGAGTVRNHLGRHPVHRMRYTAREDGKQAATHWRVLWRGRGFSLIRCRLETGRTHQVRVHLSELGYPLVGDPLYGRRRAVPSVLSGLVEEQRQLLHAAELHLVHPRTQVPCQWEAPLPYDFRAVARRLGAPETNDPS